MSQSVHNVWLHRFAALTACATFLLLIAGGMVTSTGSGLSVPDWPLSYGMVMPPMVGGVFYEHGHRMIASTVGLLTLVMTIWLLAKEPRRWMRRLGIAALLAVVVQGILGGMTVKYFLPTPVSVSHAGLAEIFFGLTICMAVFTSRRWKQTPAVRYEDRGLPLRTLCLMTAGVIFIQILLGALVRHTESGLAIPDFPLAYGQVIPPMDAKAVEQINHDRRWDLDREWPPVTAKQILIHFVHRVGALVVSAFIAFTAWKIFKHHRRFEALTWPAGALGLLVVEQIMLGGITIWSHKQPILTTAHVAVGALIWGTSVFLVLMSFRLAPHTVRESLMPTGVQEASA